MARVDPSERPTKGSYARVPTQVLAVDGVEPTAESIAEGRYPLIADVVLLHRADLPPEGPAARLRDWLAGAEGQAWILRRGFVPLHVPPSPPGP
jgi:phosphate transport system substrate-binding protein